MFVTTGLINDKDKSTKILCSLTTPNTQLTNVPQLPLKHTFLKSCNMIELPYIVQLPMIITFPKYCKYILLKAA